MRDQSIQPDIAPRYCVTVMDSWPPMREFWTLEGAKRFYRQHRECANVFKWEDGCWYWMCGANDRGVMLSPYMAVTRPRREGFFERLTPEQQKAALEYDGPENHGDPAFARPHGETP